LKSEAPIYEVLASLYRESNWREKHRNVKSPLDLVFWESQLLSEL
jgi:hypothetical protein